MLIVADAARRSISRLLSVPFGPYLFSKAYLFLFSVLILSASPAFAGTRDCVGADPLDGPYARLLGRQCASSSSALPGPAPLVRRAAQGRARPAPVNVTRGGLRGMEVAITFDGGYEAEDAGVILDALKERSIRTTIFLTGSFIRMYPGIVRRIVRDGHEVGNHTMSHPHLTGFEKNYRQETLDGVDREFLAGELARAARLFRETTGVEMAPLWRAPYGEVNAELMGWALDEGYLHVGWTYDYKTRESLDTRDWVRDRSSRLYLSAAEIKRRILGFGRGAAGVRGGIILMHLGTGRRRDKASSVLPEMLDALMQRGYRFVKVSEMIAGNRVLEAAARIRAGRVALLASASGAGEVAMLDAASGPAGQDAAAGGGGADGVPVSLSRAAHVARAERRALFLLDP